MTAPDVVVLRPVDDSAEVTLSYIDIALGLLCATTHVDQLDEGQRLMVHQAQQRIEQVARELRADDV